MNELVITPADADRPPWPKYERNPWHDISRTAVALLAEQPVTPAEAALETAIEIARASMLERQRAEDIEGARSAQAEMCDLISQRTPAQVERMEQRRGLRK